MVDSNNPPPGGTAELIENSQADVDQELENKVGKAVEASLEDEEQAETTKAKPAEGETTDEESNDKAEEEESETEEEPKDEDEKPTTIKFKDGREFTLEELERGVLRQEDYTRKTQEVANNRREVQAHAQDLIQRIQAQDEREKHIEEQEKRALSLIERFSPKPPDTALMDTDPVGYMRHKEAFERARGEIEQLSRQQQARQQQALEQQKAQFEAHRAREREALLEKVPELRDDARASAFWRDALDIGGKAYGITREGLESVNDHISYMVLKDAIAYRKLQNSKMEVVRKAKEAPPMKSAVRQAPNARANQSRQANLDRLRQEGTEEAAMAVLPDELFN